MPRYSKSDCIGLLNGMYERLKESGEDRYPRRADFSEEEVTAIKAELGPWPRALEAAGIKPVDEEAALRKARRRERNRRNRKKNRAVKTETSVE